MENEEKRVKYGMTDYEVDTDGNIFGKHGKKIKPQLSKDGYYYFNQYLDGKMYHKRIHRVVCETFISNPEQKEFVNHIDGNKLNNKLTNLEWVTHSENLKHSYNLGLHDQKGTKNNRSKLNEQQVKDIRNLFDKKIKKHSTILSQQFGVTRRTVERIIKGELWNQI